MINKKFLKQFIDNQNLTSRVEMALLFLEERSKNILEVNDWYKDLFIDPNVDIVNSHPQVTQQVREELEEFLNLLEEHEAKSILQIGLGHWGSTHFVLSLLLDSVTTLEYDSQFISRYQAEMDFDFEKIHEGDSTKIHGDIKEEFDAVFIDGNHSYEYVKKDLENFAPKVKEGGIVALHDANFEGERYGTPRVLRETDYDWKFISHSKEVGIAYFIKESK